MPLDPTLDQMCAAIVRRFEADMLAVQEDAALVAAMAEQANEDAEIFDMMLDAGCSFDECRAAFAGNQVVN